MKAERLLKAVKHVRPPPGRGGQGMGKVAVGNFQYKMDGLEMGDLSGNRFSIVLRNISLEQGI